jgi:hypothetical protein
MTLGLDTRLPDPLDQLRVIASHATPAQHEVNSWSDVSEASGRLNEIVVILLGVESGCHSNHQRIVRNSQLTAKREAGRWIRSELG